MHPVDSNEISFKLAARNAFKEAFRNAGPKIMEPIYNVEVLVPSDYMGAVMSDLQNRRAMIAGMESDKGFDRLNATVPLAELYRYSTTLSSLTSGSATLLDEILLLRAGSGRRAGQAAEGLHRHRPRSRPRPKSKGRSDDNARRERAGQTFRRKERAGRGVAFFMDDAPGRDLLRCYPNATQKHGRKIRHKESTVPAHSSGSALERQFYRRIRETPC